MGVSVKTKSLDTVEEGKLGSILAAAQKRFGYYGLSKTTMNEIASDVGMSKASLYYYFPDKESLFEMVIKKEQEAFIEEVTKLINGSSKASFLLTEYVKRRQYYFKKFLNLGKLKFDSLVVAKPIMCDLIESFKAKELELIRQIIQQGTSQKEFKKVNVKEYSELFMMILQGLRLVSLKNNRDSELSEDDHKKLNKNMNKAVMMFLNEIKVH